VPLPTEVRVKISSEFAGAIAMTEVAVQVISIRDLVEQMLGVTGKDAGRVLDILRRGTLVAGESRLRWQGIQAGAADLAAVFSTFPDPDPSRPFHPAACFHAQLIRGREKLDMLRMVAAKRRFLRRRSFWDVLMQSAAASGAEYVGYSYKLRCDHYRLTLARGERSEIAKAASLLPSRKLAEQIRAFALDGLDLFVRRGGC